MSDNKILPVTPDVQWIGVLDADLITFDIVMETKYGTTYNSYFINADKKTIVETAKDKYFDTYLAKIKQLCNPEEIEYIIVNHTEPDHSGSLKQILDVCPNATVVGSGNAIRYLNDLIGEGFKFLIVKDNDVLNLGNKSLKFISAPNLHWPDSMYTYLQEDKVLFTCDSFGAHYCDERMYDDLIGNWDDAFKYYFDVILKPFSKFMLKAIEKIRPLEISTICTGHGPILRSHWKRIVDLSEQYSKEALALPDENRVLVAFVSAYHNTEQVAAKIAEGIRMAGDIQVDLVDIEKLRAEDMDTFISHANALVIGSPTINQNILPQIYQMFALINPIRDRGKLAGAFGSYGWSGEGAKIIESNLTNLKLDWCGNSYFFKFSPREEQLEGALRYGKEFGVKFMSKQ